MINQMINDDQKQLQVPLYYSDCERKKMFSINSSNKMISNQQSKSHSITTRSDLNFSVERILCNDKMTNKDAVSHSEIHHQDKQIIRPMPLRYLPTNPSSMPVFTPTAYGVRQDIYKFSNSYGPQRHNLHDFNAIHSINQNENYTNSITMSSSSPMASSSSSSILPGNGKRKRSWSRAVFSQLQRKGLEIQFQIQKYITKPDRRKLAARLGLTDAQVKVWFQNRRMKWRHSRDAKYLANKKLKRRDVKSLSSTSGDEGGDDLCSDSGTSNSNASTDDDDEIDVVTE